ncbi:MAG: hypothetical protein DCC52_07385 [Chloroflexi bacterium]|nr:MAG: hypothetical protein DCC52_07385 [Chloroflexota bacterium]
MAPTEKAFEEAMLDIYEQAKEYGYYPNYFLRMVQEHGAVDAAKRLLEAENPTYGLAKLWELKRLDLSMEALVIQPQFQSLFTTREVDKAMQTLKALGYFK